MKKLQQLFTSIVDRIEDQHTPLKRYLFLFLAILSVRLCLEFFSNQRLFRAEDAIHISLWFIFIVECFMLQLHLFSQEKMEKIIRLVVCCFSIALTAPIIDLVVSQGKLSKMNYLAINSFSDMLYSYITIGGASLSRGATLGIRIEIVLLVIASFNYVYTKTNSWVKAIIGSISIYTVLFLSGAIPYFIGKLNEALQLIYAPDDQSSIYLLFTLDVLLSLFIILRLKRIPWKPAIDWIFVFRFAVGAACVGCGAYFALINYPGNWKLDPTTLYYFPLLLVWGILIAFYDSFGRKKRFGTSTFGLQNGLFLFATAVAACISFYTCFAALICWGILFILHEAPLYFNRIRILSSLFQGALAVALLFVGFLTFRAPLIGFPTWTLFIVLFVSFSIHLIYRLVKHTKHYDA